MPPTIITTPSTRLASILASPTSPKQSAPHLAPLERLASQLDVSKRALTNAKKLAQGDGEIVLLLLEPTNRSNHLSYDEMVNASPTLLFLREKLKENSKTLEDTSVFDIRPFRNDSQRRYEGRQSKHQQIANDIAAYQCCKEMFEILKPKVVVVCQCATSQESHSFARQFSSSMRTSGTQRVEEIILPDNTLWTPTIINSFHPMKCEYSKGNPFQYAKLVEKFRCNLKKGYEVLRHIKNASKTASAAEESSLSLAVKNLSLDAKSVQEEIIEGATTAESHHPEQLIKEMAASVKGVQAATAKIHSIQAENDVFGPVKPLVVERKTPPANVEVPISSRLRSKPTGAVVLA